MARSCDHRSADLLVLSSDRSNKVFLKRHFAPFCFEWKQRRLKNMELSSASCRRPHLKYKHAHCSKQQTQFHTWQKSGGLKSKSLIVQAIDQPAWPQTARQTTTHPAGIWSNWCATNQVCSVLLKSQVLMRSYSRQWKHGCVSWNVTYRSSTLYLSCLIV